MKSIFTTSKRSIAAILTLCILLGIAGTCVYATSVMPEENIAVTEETTQELVPVMVSACEDEDDPYPLVNGYYGSPGISGGAMRIMSGGYEGACNFFLYLTLVSPIINVTTPIPGGGTARIAPSNSAGSGYAVQITTVPGQPFKFQRVHFN